MTEYRFGADTTTEPREEEVTTTTLPTVYQKMRAELGKPAVVEATKTIPVGPTRPGWALKFSTNLPLEKLDRWRISARKVKGKDALDMRRYNSLIISSQCLCLVYNGEDFVDEDGNYLNFNSQEVIDMLKAYDYSGAIMNFFGRDSDIIKFGTEVLEACGYLESDEEDEDDPLASDQD